VALCVDTRLGPYEILTPLGTGGMGEVWLAKDHRLQRKVAIKILPTALTQHAARVERLRREAHAASALNHPNVCTIYELGEISDCQQFIAMEFVEGTTVRDRLAAGRLKTLEALDLTIPIAALTAAHAAGLLHRDIKPENVIIRPDGVVKVLDFGLAKLTGLAGEEGDATRTVLGTDAGT
jgi:serine/threonine protein kinase